MQQNILNWENLIRKRSKLNHLKYVIIKINDNKFISLIYSINKKLDH